MLKSTCTAASCVLALNRRRFHVVIVMACALLVVPLGSRAQPHNPNVRHRVILEGDEPQLGPSDALVTVVEFGGFQDSFSARVAPTLEELTKRYPKDVRVVWLNNPLPFHRNGLVAANAALEAKAQKGNAGFWAMHGKLLANQGALDRASLEAHANIASATLGDLRRA